MISFKNLFCLIVIVDKTTEKHPLICFSKASFEFPQHIKLVDPQVSNKIDMLIGAHLYILKHSMCWTN